MWALPSESSRPAASGKPWGPMPEPESRVGGGEASGLPASSVQARAVAGPTAATRIGGAVALGWCCLGGVVGVWGDGAPWWVLEMSGSWWGVWPPVAGPPASSGSSRRAAADPRATRSGEAPVSPLQAFAVAGPTTATRIGGMVALGWCCSGGVVGVSWWVPEVSGSWWGAWSAVAGPTTATRIGGVVGVWGGAVRYGLLGAVGSGWGAWPPVTGPTPASASRYGASASTVRAEVSTSQAASPAMILRAVASSVAASPGTVRVTAARSTLAPARSSAEAMRSRSLRRGSRTARPDSGAPPPSRGSPGRLPVESVREVDCVMASVPPGLVGVQVDDLVGAVLQQNLGRPGPQRLGRPNRLRRSIPGSFRPPSGLGQLGA